LSFFSLFSPCIYEMGNFCAEWNTSKVFILKEIGFVPSKH